MSTIVHIGPAHLPVTHSRGGAIERRILELGHAQVGRGHKVIIYSAADSPDPINLDGLEIRQCVCRAPATVRAIELTRAALQQLRTEPVDVLHFHSVAEGAFLARSLRVPKFLSYDDFRFRRGRSTPMFWCYRQLLSRFDRLFPVSEYCRRESLAYWSLDAARATVLYNGVNLEQFSPATTAATRLKCELGLADEPVVLYAGRVCEQKGTDVLLDAWQLLKAQIPALSLVVCGPPGRFGNHAETDLTRRIEALGGIYLGAVEEAQLSTVLNLCDVFVMPTRRDEMFGMAALEAQACGKPVVCSRHGGLVEVVSEQSGMLFPVGDYLALAACLRTILEDRGLHARLAAAARPNAARFSWSSLAERVESLYGTDSLKMQAN